MEPQPSMEAEPRSASSLVGAHVLLVEDDPEVAEVVDLLLTRAGLRVSTVADGREALGAFMNRRFDLVLLDILLPSLDGFEVCRQIRRVSSLPIVMLTARAETAATVAGLELGADDYVTKPFDGPELVARIRAVLRRASTAPGESIVSAGPFRLDPAAFKAWKGDDLLTLTTTEFRLLHQLLRYRGEVLTRESLLRDVWRYKYAGDTRLVDMAILRLREKIETDPSSPTHIVTVRGVGYRFEDS